MKGRGERLRVQEGHFICARGREKLTRRGGSLWRNCVMEKPPRSRDDKVNDKRRGG